MKTFDKYLCILDSLVNSEHFKLSYDAMEQYEILKEVTQQASFAEFAEKQEEEKHE